MQRERFYSVYFMT